MAGDPVALRRPYAAGGNAIVEIDDEGPGIPETLQQRVFDPFFRAESSGKRATGRRSDGEWL